MSGSFCRTFRVGAAQPFTNRGDQCASTSQNGHEFIQRAAEILPKPIEIIAGREEARLIYLGVSHTMANGGRRLVVDIGGGSTEFIIGEEFEPIQTESLQMGCVAFTKAYFAEGEISAKILIRLSWLHAKSFRQLPISIKLKGGIPLWDPAVPSRRPNRSWSIWG